jgi:hypothetical protein
MVSISPHHWKADDIHSGANEPIQLSVGSISLMLHTPVHCSTLLAYRSCALYAQFH